MKEKLRKLTELVAEIVDINHSIALLGWDQQVFMPSGAAEERGYMIGSLAKSVHEKLASKEMGILLDDLKKFLPDLDPDGEIYRLIYVTARDYEKNKWLPVKFVVEKAHTISLAQQAWLVARANSDFSVFRPHLEKVLELSRSYVSFYPPVDEQYDTLLDVFEPGLKTLDLQNLLSKLLPAQVDLIQSIRQRPQVDDSFLSLDYDERSMWDFSVKVASSFGYDWRRGRQDSSAHPFCQSIGSDDVRITSRWVPEMPFALLFGTMHETGHALYEQGVGHAWSRTFLEGGASLSIHESQSRLWENQVGRSLAFWEYFYPQLQDSFKTQLGNVGIQQFYRAINKVKPSFIRVEADEATYNLHIMVRIELEIGLLAGTIAVQDLPEIWNEKMMDYLGVFPPNDAKGVLQDIHWSGGMFGYFSTYVLGNVIAAQLWDKFIIINPDLDNQLRNGDFSSLLSWLRVKIHQYGRKYEPQELVKRVTNSEIDSRPYLEYLYSKYNGIYGLEKSGVK